MKCATQLLLCTLIGGGATACIIFLYRAYILASSGISPDSMLLWMLLTDVMELHRWAFFGGAFGFVGAPLASLVERVRRFVSARRTSLTAPSIGSRVDPDQLIRHHRARRAERYLAHRRARCGGAGPPM